MGRPKLTRVRRQVLFMACFAATSLSRLGLTQDAIPARGHVFLPPTRGATALSAAIDARAHLVMATGDFLESAAIARRHHAAATEHDIRNSVEWVRAYFERKEINRAYRQKYNPTFMQQYEKSQRLKENLLETRPEYILSGDVTDELNLMLDKLSSHTLAHEILFGKRSLGELNAQLDLEDLKNLVLTDGKGKGASYVTFRAERGTPLAFDWPMTFLEKGFDAARARFESAREQLLEDARDGRIDAESWTELQTAIDDLSAELQRQFPRSRTRNNPQEFLVYNAARRFLMAKASMVFTARVSADTKYLTETYAFDGTGMLELLQHMTHHGLRFAPPEGGGEPSYRRLFLIMRQFYLRYLGSDSS